MIERTQILEELQQLKPLLQKDFSLTELALFGMHVKIIKRIATLT